MSESQVRLKCDKINVVEASSHLVEAMEGKSAPPMEEPETMVKSAAKTKLLSSSIVDRYRREEGPSGSKVSSISPRSGKKRKRDGYKTRMIPSGDDSESGEPQFGHQSSGGPSSFDQQGRKKRQRRRKNRKYKPYNKLSWQERREQEDRETRRANRVRAQRFANGQPVAPYNTTQFLMDDHNDLKDIDVKQGPAANHPPLFPRIQRGQRARDSSFSLESEEDFYYSSPEDEKEFLTKEFSSAYEDLHAEQLNAQPKAKLVQELVAMEKKVDSLEKELIEVRTKRLIRVSSDEDAGTTDERALLFKAEITKLSEENNRLRAENECLRRRCFGEDAEMNHTTSTSSIDSESDSTASTTGTCSSSSSQDDDDEKMPKPIKPPVKPELTEKPPGDQKSSPSSSSPLPDEKMGEVEKMK